MRSGGSGSGHGGGRGLLLVWDVSADQEYVGSRRRLGISAESVWLVAKPSGGGRAVVYLEALDPERALGELAASKAFFDSWYSGRMRKLFGFDLARLPWAKSGELLFAWRDDDVPGEHEAP